MMKNTKHCLILIIHAWVIRFAPYVYAIFKCVRNPAEGLLRLPVYPFMPMHESWEPLGRLSWQFCEYLSNHFSFNLYQAATFSHFTWRPACMYQPYLTKYLPEQKNVLVKSCGGKLNIYFMCVTSCQLSF